MKTGILTFHSAYNFGASLQAWALQTTLEKLGAQPYIINYRPAIIDNLYNPLANKTGLKKSRLLRRMINPEQMQRVTKYEGFIQNELHLIGEAHSYEELQNENFALDACIVGSDQVWNVQHTGGDSAYFLDFFGGNVKKISYAASIGTDYILPSYYEEFRMGLQKFDHISVRESSAVPVLGDLTDKPIQVVLDPTLLLDVEEYEKIKNKVHYDEKYILVYMMEYNPKVVELANYASRLLGIPVVQRRPKKIFMNELKSCYTYTPGEFLSCVEQAEMVITNSFHGTVFSILYGKPFVSMLHTDTGSRTVDLLQTLGLESHLLIDSDKRAFIDKMNFSNKKEVHEKINVNRKKSLDFLKSSLALG